MGTAGPRVDTPWRAPGSGGVDQDTETIAPSRGPPRNRRRASPAARRAWLTVWSARDLTAGEAVATGPAATRGRGSTSPTTPPSPPSASSTTHGRPADVLVNNAGVSAAPGRGTPPLDFLPVYGVNVLDLVRPRTLFLPLFDWSAQPRVVKEVERLGLFGVTTDPGRFDIDHRRARLPVVEGRAQHDHEPVREGAGGVPGSSRSTWATPRLHGFQGY